MRTKFIAGNWKMNNDVHQTGALIAELTSRMKDLPAKVEVAVCPPFTSLVVASSLLKGTAMRLGAQNMSEKDDGAFTGEISGKMLRAVGCEYVILGHSERRQYYHETDALINAKLKKALATGLKAIVCVGETLDEREHGVTDNVVTAQVRGVLQDLTSEDMQNVVVAYEPVWAIGTGKTATTAQATEVHRLIRKTIGQMFSWNVAEGIRIQYGGSVNAANARELLSEQEIDGALVGGASLKPDSFSQIVFAAAG